MRADFWADGLCLAIPPLGRSNQTDGLPPARITATDRLCVRSVFPAEIPVGLQDVAIFSLADLGKNDAVVSARRRSQRMQQRA